MVWIDERGVDEVAAEQLAAVGVDELVVRLFAALHDCQRHHDGRDRDHGARAAAYIRQLQLPLDAGISAARSIPRRSPIVVNS